MCVCASVRWGCSSGFSVCVFFHAWGDNSDSGIPVYVWVVGVYMHVRLCVSVNRPHLTLDIM